MAVSVVAYNTNEYSDTGPTVSGTWTPAENDQLVVFLSCTNTFVPQTISGWSDLSSGSVTPGDNSTSVTSIRHTVTSGEATAVTTSYSLSGLFSGTETGRWWLVVLRGVDPVNPIDGVGTWFTAGDTDTNHQLAAISGTGLSDNSFVLRQISSDGPNRTYTTPGGHTKLMDGGTNSGGWVGYRDALTSAGVDIPAAATTVSTGDEGVAISVAVRAAATEPVVNLPPKPQVLLAILRFKLKYPPPL